MKAVALQREQKPASKLVERSVSNRLRRGMLREALWGYVMIAPLMIGVCIFNLWPVVQNLYFSFTKWGAFGKYHWTGLSNYVQVAQDTDLRSAFVHTFLYTIVSVPCSIALSIVVAVLLNQKLRGMLVYRTLFFLPAVTMPAAIAIVWRWLYNGDYGLINAALHLIGIQGPRWIADSRTALWALIVVAIWTSLGSNMILFLAGLQGIPSTYYEAAAIDGSGRFTTFFRITLPLLSPTIFFAAVIGMINSFQVFDLLFLMFERNSSPLYATESIVYLFYDHAIDIGDKGYAATIAVILLVIILLITMVQFKLQQKWVHYA